MKKVLFTGAATALVTPMNQDGSVNYDRLKSLINEQITAGIDALVICGTTGEKSTLRYDEHVKVIEVSAKAINGRVPIIEEKNIFFNVIILVSNILTVSSIT